MHARRFILLFLKCAVFFFSAAACEAGIELKADQQESIAHFRAFTPYLQHNQEIPFIRHLAEDAEGFMWFVGNDQSLMRYNAYELEEYPIDPDGEFSGYSVPMFFRDSARQFWVAGTGISRFDSTTESFESFDPTNKKFIRAVAEDENGNLWLGGTFGIVLFNTKTKALQPAFSIDSTALGGLDVFSIAYDRALNTLWIAAGDGIYWFNKGAKQLNKVATPLDSRFKNFYIRDIALDTTRNDLWVGTPKGLIRIDTETQAVKIYTPSSSLSSANSLPTIDVTTAYVDSASNVWLGLEKLGLCLFRHRYEDFLCIESSFDEKDKIPFATVEDIVEDSAGSLWLAMNSFGVVRINPDLEKFNSIRNQLPDSVYEYFPNTVGSVVRPNGEIWLATDGGGINIHNYKTGEFKNIQHDPKNPNSLPSDSVLTLALDEKGEIWAGTWAAGLSRIDPDTMRFTNYAASESDNEQSRLVSNDIFFIALDESGGAYLSVWNYGLQYLNPSLNRYKNYTNSEKNHTDNRNILQIKMFNELVWFVGVEGLEYLDPSTDKIEKVMGGDSYPLTSLYIESLEKIYLGSERGLIIFNSVTNEEKRYTTADGLSDNQIFYLEKDKYGKLWIATNNGLSIFEEDSETFTNFFQEDGLAGNTLSSLGHFFTVEDKLYMMGKKGVNFIDPVDIPKYRYQPRTILTGVDYLSSEGAGDNRTLTLKSASKPKIDYGNNSLAFSFTSLSFVFPERNRFRYRLRGWQDSFSEIGAAEREVRFTNLAPGDYSFEVFASNGKDVWDSQGVTYPFTVLRPWYSTWWSMLLFSLAAMAVIFGSVRARLAINIRREKELTKKVEEKTFQLEQNAREIKERARQLEIEVTERKLAESKLFHMAFHDSLT